MAVVKDDQGGVLPGVTVVVVNQSTGERREAVSTEDGSARFTNLVPGPYRVEAELTGFQRWVREGSRSTSRPRPASTSRWRSAASTETLTVTGQAPLLQTQSASVATTVGARAVQEMPLNGRNVLNLISLAPSVVPQGGADGSLTGKNVFAAGNYQIGGGTANQSASFFDGVTVQDTAYGNIVVLTPSPDSVEEFSVQTNSSSAEFGRFTGGVVNMASRSGTNAFRGSMFEFHRNRELNSNTYFGEKAGLEKPPFTQNNFGGTIGGPVLRDKLFFFGSYEGYRNEEGILLRRTVPTAAMRDGDFSDFRNQTTGAVVPIYDPWTQCGINNPGSGAYNGDCGTVPNRLQFPGNIIPSNRINSIARSLLAFPIYADPTVSGPWRNNNYETNAQIGGDNNQLNFRGDYNAQPERPHDRPLHPDGLDQRPGRSLRQRTVERRSVFARALHHHPGDAGQHLDPQLDHGVGCPLRVPALGLRPRAGQPGHQPHAAVRVRADAVRRDLPAQRHPGDGDDSEHRGHQQQHHQHRPDLRRRPHLHVHADADQDQGRPHHQGGRQLAAR